MSAAQPAPNKPPAQPLPPRPPRLLATIHGPADVKAMPAEWLPALAQEIRDELVQVTARNGGHLGPNLGVVELTIALHRVFDTPRDKFVFDVSHQGYVHKLLTGRAGEAFQLIRKTGGLSGFLNRDESPHDSFGSGHAGTALSAALGLATARDLLGTGEHVVALCGDAAFTCGISMEALNNVVPSTKRLVVVLNDNEWSISRNVGAMAKYLNELSTSPTYNRIYHDVEEFFRSTPRGERLHRVWMKWKRETKDFFVESSLFEKYGLRYLGPIDGHDIPLLVKNLEFAKQSEVPVVVHVLTKKGKGYDVASAAPERFHGIAPFDIATGNGRSTPGATPPYQEIFGRALLHEAQLDNRVVGITSAMASGTGLSILAKQLPRQFFDVGIAEEHAVLFAAGLAAQGLKPVVAIYSTFLQRSYDQVVHDICLQKLPVVVCLDRAGLSPNDGPTHHGLFDLSYLRNVPHAAIAQPKNEDELADLLHTALQHSGPVFLRYPRGSGPGVQPKERPEQLPVGKAEILREGGGIVFWALGPWVQDALDLADRLECERAIRPTVVNARWVKPLDLDLLLSQARSARLLVTFEDNVAMGGFGSAVLEALNDAALTTPVERIAWPDVFIEHGSNVSILRAAHGLDNETIYRRIAARLT